jgi:hypothetical protein
MTDEQFAQLTEMLETLHEDLREVVTENQTAAAQLGDIFSELQRLITELGY